MSFLTLISPSPYGLDYIKISVVCNRHFSPPFFDNSIVPFTNKAWMYAFSKESQEIVTFQSRCDEMEKERKEAGQFWIIKRKWGWTPFQFGKNGVLYGCGKPKFISSPHGKKRAASASSQTERNAAGDGFSPRVNLKKRTKESKKSVFQIDFVQGNESDLQFFQDLLWKKSVEDINGCFPVQ